MPRTRRFRHAGLRPLVGDNAEVSYSDSSVEQTPDGIRPSADRTGLVLSDILPRRNSLIRPPLANLDMMLVVTAAAAPAPRPADAGQAVLHSGAQPDCACFRGRQAGAGPRSCGGADRSVPPRGVSGVCAFLRQRRGAGCAVGVCPRRLPRQDGCRVRRVRSRKNPPC
ncbi:MAG: hypothetical protein L6V84_04940 [Oscillospiraceae bacterium]|nr:MAG: hypothetical protein L6V84_04940 [Oscillospiraceae bacterium]